MVSRGQGRSLAEKNNHKLLGGGRGNGWTFKKNRSMSPKITIFGEGPETSYFLGKRRNIVVSLGTLTTNLLPPPSRGSCFGTICLNFPLLLVGTARMYVVQICLMGLLLPFRRGKIFEQSKKG